jgi:dynein heavy chain
MLDKTELGPDSKKALRLWVHEVARVFSDRLTDEDDQRKLFTKLGSAAREKIREDLASALRPQPHSQQVSMLEEEGHRVMSKGILFTHLLPDGRGVADEVSQADREAQQQHLTKLLEDFNCNTKKPLPIVLFDYAMVHLLRICRILKMP